MPRYDPEPRMLTQAQAALYCGMGVKAFRATCPIIATTLRDGLSRFDRYKLDEWLDSLSVHSAGSAPIDWLGKLFEAEDGQEARHGRNRGAGEGSKAISR